MRIEAYSQPVYDTRHEDDEVTSYLVAGTRMSEGKPLDTARRLANAGKSEVKSGEVSEKAFKAKVAEKQAMISDGRLDKKVLKVALFDVCREMQGHKLQQVFLNDAIDLVKDYEAALDKCDKGPVSRLESCRTGASIRAQRTFNALAAPVAPGHVREVPMREKVLYMNRVELERAREIGN